MKRSASHITTDRLWMRQIDETDAQSIVKLRSKDRIYRYFLNPKELTLGEHNCWYRNNYVPNENRIDWMAVNDNDGTFVGVFGAKKVGLGEAEIRKGYASEAVRAIISWCVNSWTISFVMVEIHKDNKSSIQFAKKLGFQKKSDNGSFLRMERAATLLGQKNVIS